MMETMKLSDKTKNRIVKTKNYSRETMEEVVIRLLDFYQNDPDLLLTEEEVKDVEEGLDDIKAGRVYSHEQVGQMLKFKK